jgi:DNA polymerase-3 subunit epsilon
LALNALLKSARAKSFRIWAIGSAFEKKDLLKNRGYRWWPGGQLKKRSWYIDVDENSMESETTFLKEEIYEKTIDLPIDVITPFNRFSDRLGVD